MRRIVASLIALSCMIDACSEDNASLLQLARTIALPNVEGRIDHMAIDTRSHRLFVAALENNTVEIVDIEKGERIQTIKNLHEPQGVAYIPETNALVIANGGDGSCQFYDATSLKLTHSVDLQDDADNLRYASQTHQIYAGHSSGALAIIDAKTAQKLADVKLPAHPEAFEIDAQNKKAYVNVPSAKSIVVVDLEKDATTSEWKLHDARSNFPMAVDPAGHRLFAGCRSPARLLVFDTESGREVSSLEISGDTDDVFYDATARLVLVTAGEGSIDVLSQIDPDHYKQLGRVPTASGARTSLFCAENRTLYVAVPHRGAQPAEIRSYLIKK